MSTPKRDLRELRNGVDERKKGMPTKKVAVQGFEPRTLRI